MQLPSSLRPVLDPLEPLVRNWPVRVPFERVIEWLLQFEPDDYELAARIVRHLNVVGYDDIQMGLRSAYARLVRRASELGSPIDNNKNTLYAALGETGKSGGMMAYQFRLANALPEANFESEGRLEDIKTGEIRNIVLLDDIIATGKTAIDAVEEISAYALPAGVKNIFVIAVCGYDSGLEKLEESGGCTAFSAFTFSAIDTVASIDGSFYDGIPVSRREATLDRLRYYNRACSRSDLGHGNIGALIAFQFNTPNATLPVVRHTSSGWKPLFPRIGKVRGIETLRERYRAQPAPKPVPQPAAAATPQAAASPLREVTLVVEGPADQMLFDELVAHFEIDKQLAIEKIQVIAYRGAHDTERFLSFLSRANEPFIFVLENEGEAKPPKIEEGKLIGTVFIGASPLGLFRLADVRNDYSLDLEKELPESPTSPRWLPSAELYLRRRGLGRSVQRTRDFIAKYADPAKVGDFVLDLRKVLDVFRERVGDSSLRT